jgi:hypothetical protein
MWKEVFRGDKMNAQTYSYVEITYIDGTIENQEFADPFELSNSTAERINDGDWLLVASTIGSHLINKNQIRSLRFHNDFDK